MIRQLVNRAVHVLELHIDLGLTGTCKEARANQAPGEEIHTSHSAKQCRLAAAVGESKGQNHLRRDEVPCD